MSARIALGQTLRKKKIAHAARCNRIAVIAQLHSVQSEKKRWISHREVEETARQAVRRNRCHEYETECAAPTRCPLNDDCTHGVADENSRSFDLPCREQGIRNVIIESGEIERTLHGAAAVSAQAHRARLVALLGKPWQ